MPPAIVAPAAWRLPDLPRPAEGPPPAVDAATMIEADRRATDEVGMGLLQLMENAGLQLAELTRLTLGGSVDGRQVVVLAGTGNNAGGGLVAARRLSGWGARVRVAFAQPLLRLRPGPCAQLEPMLAAGVAAAVAGHDRAHADLRADVAGADAVLDALIGFRLCGAPDGAHGRLIELSGAGHGAVISLDVPSGVDATTGAVPGHAVRADATLALALPKRGMLIGEGARAAGVPYLADIGLPPSIFTGLGIDARGTFAAGPLLRLA